MKYDLKDILTFTTIAKLKSFTKASDSLNISKGVVTTRINDLENAIGITLLARTTREVNLTTDGQNFLNYCNEILEKVGNLDDFLDGYKGIKGVLKIALPPYFSRHHIAPHIGEFLEKYPDLKLDIQLTENPINIIDEGKDLQVRIQIPQDENLQVAKLMSNKKVVCASSGYMKNHSMPESPNDLLKHNCIVFGENSVWKFKHKKTSEITELRNIKGSITCNNGEIIKELTLSGIGITLKSACDIEEEIKKNKLIILLPNYEVVNETEFYAVYPSGKNISPKIIAFIDFFQKKLLSKEFGV